MALHMTSERAAADLRFQAEMLIEAAKELLVADDIDARVSVAGRVAECAGALRYIADAIELPR